MRRRWIQWEPRQVSPEERTRRDARPRLPKVEGMRGRGLVFFLAFVYAPDGVKMFTGDLGVIEDNAKKLPTSHGWIVPYRGGKQIGPAMPHLFGKHTHAKYGVFPAVHMMPIGCRKKECLSHRKWKIFVRTSPTSTVVLATLRSLPKQHLRCLKKVETLAYDIV